jgi:hypothetical protein
MSMKETFEKWRGFLTESAEKGKKFEVVVVQTVRLNSGAEPLTGPEYDNWEQWSKLTSVGDRRTLGNMAQDLYQVAETSGFFKISDFKNARIQDIGKQKYAGEGRRIEIKTDATFGDKTISIKMPGDTQADSSKVSAIISKVGVVVGALIEEIEDDVVAENFRKSYEEAFTDEVKNKIIKASETRYLTDKRVKALIKRIETTDGTKKKTYQDVLGALKLDSIIDENNKIIKEDLKFDPGEITSDIEKAIKSTFADNGMLAALIKELLTGAAGFRDIPGAAAQYLLSPEHAFDLEDEDTIELFSNAIKMRISLKGGRKLNIESIDSIKKGMGSEISLRWDIKKKDLLEAVQEAKLIFAPSLSNAPKMDLSEQATAEEKDFEELYDEIQNIMIAAI